MNRNVLYVANLAPGITSDSLGELFSQYGEASHIDLLTPDRLALPAAKVTLATEKAATRALIALNGHDLDGYRLAVSHFDADLSREMTGKQRAAAEQFAAELGETEKIPLRQLAMMTRLCGPAFVAALITEAREIDAGPGMMTVDGSQRRSLGGVFFHLATARMSPPVRFLVINRKGKPYADAS